VQAFPQGLGLNWDEELPAAAWTQHLTVARTALQRIDRRETPADLAVSVSEGI